MMALVPCFLIISTISIPLKGLFAAIARLSPETPPENEDEGQQNASNGGLKFSYSMNPESSKSGSTSPCTRERNITFITPPVKGGATSNHDGNNNKIFVSNSISSPKTHKNDCRVQSATCWPKTTS
jgi:hypothetical protein